MNNRTELEISGSPSTRPQLDWINIAFLGLTPVVGIFGTIAWTLHAGFSWWMPALTAGMYLPVGMGICAGYHRLFSHRAYQASRPVEIFLAFFGAMAAQNSVLWWSAMHRVHHKYVDRDWDPYNIKRGFWWAHIVWIFHKNPNKVTFENIPDLEANPVLRWQNRWYIPILVLGGFGIPTLIGAFFGNWLAGLLWGGFLRTVIVHHSTFFVNSLAHTLGRQTYDLEGSARDNWLVALLTLGEGYHSFHHRFANDYRNGIHWYQWDPAKWFIRSASAMGLARDLRRTPAPLIEQARMDAALRDLESRIQLAPEKVAIEVRERIDRAKTSLQEALALWREYSQATSRTIRRKLRRQTRSLVRDAKRDWRIAIRRLGVAPETV